MSHGLCNRLTILLFAYCCRRSYILSSRSGNQLEFVFQAIDQVCDLLWAYLISDKIQRVSFLQILNDLLSCSVGFHLPQLHLVMVKLPSRGHQILKN